MIDRILSNYHVNLNLTKSLFFVLAYSGRMNGVSTQKIRSHHETLTRENEKLVRQLHQRDRQQGQSNGKRVIVIEEDVPEEEV